MKSTNITISNQNIIQQELLSQDHNILYYVLLIKCGNITVLIHQYMYVGIVPVMSAYQVHVQCMAELSDLAVSSAILCRVAIYT